MIEKNVKIQDARSIVQFYHHKMKKKKDKNQYSKPHIGEFIRAICEQYKLDAAEVATFLVKQFPELKDKTECANCGAGMVIYEHKLDSLDALLLIGMGKFVFHNMQKGMTFNIANRVHIQDTLSTYYSVASRTTWCSKLGLITHVKRPDGTDDRRAGWLITKRGFDFLAGRPVPARVQVFRGEIKERFDEVITMAEIRSSQGPNSREAIEIESYKKYNFEELDWASHQSELQPELLHA